MLDSKQNLCLDCSNCYAHKCDYIRTGKPTQYQRARKSKIGIQILNCKLFEKDEYQRISAQDISKILQVSERDFYRYSSSGLIEALKKHNIRLRIIMDESHRSFYIKYIGGK